MKQVSFLFLCCLSVCVNAQTTQETKPVPGALIKIAPFQFFSHTLELSIEALNADYTKAFQLSAGFRSGQGDVIEGKGITGTIAYRKYVRPLSMPSKKNPDAVQGIYYSLLLRGEYFKGEEEYYGFSQFERTKETIYNLSPGFTIGLQRTIFEVLFLDVYIGGAIKFAAIDYEGTPPYEQVDYDIFHPGYEGIYPVLGVKIGVGL
jgi:hypothetical protein